MDLLWSTAGLLPGQHGTRGVRHDHLTLRLGQLAAQRREQCLRGLLAHALGGKPVGQATNLDEGERVGHQAPADGRHFACQPEQPPAELTSKAQRLVTILGGDGGVPQGEMNTTAQLDLEVDGVAFGAGDGLELLQEARLIAHRQPGTQGADELAQAGNGDEIESLAPRHAPVIHATEQQGTPQCAGLIVRTRHRPLFKFALQLPHATVAHLIGLAHTEAKHACERILREVSSLKVSQIRLLAEINRPALSAAKLEQIISADVAIAYKLLRFINSVYFSLVHKVASIRRAIIYLGETEVRRFVMLVIVSNLAADKPEELLRLSVVRARFCELLATHGTYAVHSAELFLVGLFSLLDAILDAPLETTMAALPIAAEVKEAIVGRTGPLAFFLDAVVAWEEARAEDCPPHWQRMGVDGAEVAELYLEAIRFAALID